MVSDRTDPTERRFLFLQGPHGPFFARLAQRLTAMGATCLRLGFNPGDSMFWPRDSYLPFHEPLDRLDARLAELIEAEGITDLVCYGSSRPIHKVALELARERGLTAHVFEEGYIRPYWVTYERGGANAASPLTALTLAQMERALDHGAPPLTEAPDRWGNMRAHMFWGAVYHAVLMLGVRRYPAYRPHRSSGVRLEFWLHLKRLIATPVRTALRGIATARIRLGAFPYHLVLLQLAHDANFLDHGPFPDHRSFLDVVFRGFAAGAPAHHHLVLKAHPLEDGREPLRPLVRELTRAHGLAGRVHFVTGGKLAWLMDAARTTLTVNSTAAEQALWRGLPLKVFGAAVFNRPEFTSPQPVDHFFADPLPPDHEAYLTYRSFLLATSQIPGGFYGFVSRRKLLRQMPDLILATKSPYERMIDESVEAPAQHLRLLD
ncbi:MAG: capsule biosynthesis protein CapA [Silicimonas sp.]|nr:capsule biosynthesis protein CapA [Silicimonas sp.]